MGVISELLDYLPLIIFVGFILVWIWYWFFGGVVAYNNYLIDQGLRIPVQFV